jgi:3-hydroxyisobutyrate dehydrogenase
MKVGFIGTGLLGQPMAMRLIEHGEHEVVVYNRTASKTEALRTCGAKDALLPQDVFSEAPVTILMLSDARAVREVMLSPQSRAELAGKTVVQMGTIAPEESMQLANDVLMVGGQYVEAPVLGSIPQAKGGALVVMTGCEKGQCERLRPLLETLGPVYHIGPVGTAAALKLALNQLIASLTAAFSASLGMVLRNGIDVDIFMDILRKSALYAPTFDKKLPRMIERDFRNPNFPTKHLLKDVELFLSEARRIGLRTENVDGVRTVVNRALMLGLDDEDYSSIYLSIDS